MTYNLQIKRKTNDLNTFNLLKWNEIWFDDFLFNLIYTSDIDVDESEEGKWITRICMIDHDDRTKRNRNRYNDLTNLFLVFLPLLKFHCCSIKCILLKRSLLHKTCLKKSSILHSLLSATLCRRGVFTKRFWEFWHILTTVSDCPVCILRKRIQ